MERVLSSTLGNEEAQTVSSLLQQYQTTFSKLRPQDQKELIRLWKLLA